MHTTNDTTKMKRFKQTAGMCLLVKVYVTGNSTIHCSYHPK